MPLASSLTPESNFKALFVGPKHSGKTAAACSWRDITKNKKIKVLDGDGRIRGLLGCPWIDRSFIEYDYYPPEDKSGKTFHERVNTDLEVILMQIQQGKSPYETYVGDSATSFCKNLILDAIPLTHKTQDGKGTGKRIGTLEMAGPADYGFESTGFDAYLSFLRSIPLNVIVTAHLIDKYDKPLDDNGNRMAYGENIIVGQKLSLREKIAENCKIYFDHIFEFNRRMVGKQEKFFVKFISDIACTSFPNLQPGEYDITGKDFYKFVMEKVGSKEAERK